MMNIVTETDDMIIDELEAFFAPPRPAMIQQLGSEIYSATLANNTVYWSSENPSTMYIRDNIYGFSGNYQVYHTLESGINEIKVRLLTRINNGL